MGPAMKNLYLRESKDILRKIFKSGNYNQNHCKKEKVMRNCNFNKKEENGM